MSRSGSPSRQVRLIDEDFCLNGSTAHLAFFKAKFEDHDPI